MEDDTEDDTEDNTEDNTEDDDDNKNKDEDIKTKDENEVQSRHSGKVKIGRPLRMMRVSLRSWSAGDFDVLSTASMMSYE